TERDRHDVAHGEANRGRPRKERSAVNGFRCARGIREAYALCQRRIKPYAEPVSRARARGGPLDLRLNIWALQRSIVQRRPAFRLRQKLLSLQPALVKGIGDDSSSCGHIYAVAVA